MEDREFPIYQLRSAKTGSEVGKRFGNLKVNVNENLGRESIS